jgi:hypothetical protein
VRVALVRLAFCRVATAHGATVFRLVGTRSSAGPIVGKVSSFRPNVKASIRYVSRLAVSQPLATISGMSDGPDRRVFQARLMLYPLKGASLGRGGVPVAASSPNFSNALGDHADGRRGRLCLLAQRGVGHLAGRGEGMIHIRRLVLLLYSSLALLVSGVVTANATLIDQYNFPTNYPDDSRISPILGRYNVGAQTFTVGITGTLRVFDVPVFTPLPGDTIAWQLRSTTNGVLAPFLDSTTIIASGTLTAPLGPPVYSFPFNGDSSTGFYAIDLSAYDIFVHAGDQLAILIGGFNPEQEYDHWFGTSLDQYAGGMAYITNVVRGAPILDANGNVVGLGPLIEYPYP